MKSTLSLLFGLILAVVALFACASLPPKERATKALQANETVLGAAQDAERQICDPVKAAIVPAEPITNCAGPLTQSVGLTTEKHRQFASAMAKAFDLQIKASKALDAWRAGDPVPDSLTALRTDLADTLKLVQQLSPGTAGKAQTVIEKVSKALEEVTSTSELLQSTH